MKDSGIGDQVLAYVEVAGDSIDGASLALLTKARDLATGMSRALVAVVLTGQGTDAVMAALRQKGVDKVLLVENPALEQSNPDLFSSILVDIVKDELPSVFLLPHNVNSVQIAASVAGRLAIPPVTNCIDIELADGSLRVTRPMFGGTRHATLVPKSGMTIIGTLQSRKWPIEVEERAAEVRRYDPSTAGDLLSRIKILATVQPSKEGVDLTKAEIIVSIGRGIGSKTNIPMYQELADALGGVLACSRPLADLAWLPPEHLVGMSGSTVKPRIYLACGISGAYQHLAGMQDTQNIIAINNDPTAPIFEVAHVGALADLGQVVPALLDAARASRK